MFPKRKSQSIPSICAVSWQYSPGTHTKIEHNLLNSHPFNGVFDILQGLVFILYLISKIFVYTFFESASKIMLR